MSQLGEAMQRFGQETENFGDSLMEMRKNKFKKIDNDLQNYINAQLAGINPNATPEEYKAEFDKIFNSIDADFISKNSNLPSLDKWSAKEYMDSENRSNLINSYKNSPDVYKAGYANKEHDRVQSELGTLILSMVSQEEGNAQKSINSDIYSNLLEGIKEKFSNAEEIHKLLPGYSVEAIEEFLSKHKEAMFGDYEHKKQMFGDNRIAENERKKNDRERGVALDIIDMEVQNELDKALNQSDSPELYEESANEAIEKILGSPEEFAKKNGLSEQAVNEAFDEYKTGGMQVARARIAITKNDLNVNIEKNLTSAKLKQDVEDIGKDFDAVLDEHLKTIKGEDGKDDYIDSAFSYIIQPNDKGEDVVDSRLRQEMIGFYEDNLNCTYTEFAEKYKETFDSLLDVVAEKFKGNKRAELYLETKKANKNNYASSNSKQLYDQQNELREERNINLQKSITEKFNDDLDYAPSDEELRDLIRPDEDKDREQIYKNFKVLSGARALEADMDELAKIDIKKSLTDIFIAQGYGTEGYESVEAVFESDKKTLYEEQYEMGETGSVSKGDKFTDAQEKSVNFEIGSEGNSVLSIEGATIYTRHSAVVEYFFDTHPEIEPTYYNIQYIASVANQLTAVDGTLAKKQAEDIVISPASITEKLDDLDKIKGHLSLQTYTDTKNKIEKYEGQSQTWKESFERLNKYYDSALSAYGIKAPTSSSDNASNYSLYWMFKTPEVTSIFEELATEYENAPKELKAKTREKQEERITDYINSIFSSNLNRDIISSTSWGVLTGDMKGFGFTNDIAKEEGANPWARYCNGEIMYLNDKPSILNDLSVMLDGNKDDKDMTLKNFKNEVYHKLNPNAPVTENYEDLVKESKKKKNPVVSPWLGPVEDTTDVLLQGKRFEQVVRDFLFEDDDYIGINVAGQGIMYYSPSKHIIAGQNPNVSGTGLVDIYKPKAGVETEIIKLSREGEEENGVPAFIPSFSMALDKFEKVSPDEGLDLGILVMPEKTSDELDYYNSIAYYSPQTARRVAVERRKHDPSLPEPLSKGDWKKAYDKSDQKEDWKSIIWSNPVFLNTVK